MASVALRVSGMSCQHCVRAITDAVQAKDPRSQVQVDLESGTVRVETSLLPEAVAAAVTEEGYKVEGAAP